MVALIIISLITILLTAQFYLKNSPLTSFVSVIAAIIGFVAAFSYYELLAGLMIGKGYVPDWAHSICFLLLFVIAFAIIRGLSDYIVGSNIDFGPMTKNITAIVCGIFTSLIVSGSLIIALSLAPIGRSMPYSRFGDSINISNASEVKIPADSLVSGLYSWISKGAMGSNEKSFDVYHADFLDQLHLNRFAAKSDKVATVAGNEAVFVDKHGVWIKELPDGQTQTIVELDISSKSIKDGGAMGGENEVSFILSQVRVICSPKNQSDLTGDNIKILYPEMFLFKGQVVEENPPLSHILNFKRDSFITTPRGRVARVDLAFTVPDNMAPRLLQFKSNTIVQLPKVMTEEEIEEAKEQQRRAENEAGA